MIACLSGVGFMTGGLGQVDAHSDVAAAAFTTSVTAAPAPGASTSTAAAAPSTGQAQPPPGSGDQSQTITNPGDQSQTSTSSGDQTQDDQSQGDASGSGPNQDGQGQSDQSQGDQTQGDQTRGDQTQGDQTQGDTSGSGRNQDGQGQSDQTWTSVGTPTVTARGPKKESASFHGTSAPPALAPSPAPVAVTTVPAGASQLPTASVPVTAGPAPIEGIAPASGPGTQAAAPSATAPGRKATTKSGYTVSQISPTRDPSSLAAPARSLLAPLAPAGGASAGAVAPVGHAGAPRTAGQRGSAAGADRSGAAANGATHAPAAPARPAARRPASGGDSSTSLLLVPMKFIPRTVWLALGISFALALLGTGAAVAFGRRMRRQAGEIAQVSAAALIDPLTGVLNRRGFTKAVERELARSRRYRRPFVLAYGDVRGLKAVNDSEGHLAGDALLKTVASMLTSSARAHDVVGRLGGDEFAVLLPEQSGEDALAVTQRIADQVQARRDELGFGVGWDLTIGMACFPEDGGSFEALLAAADRRLYRQRGIALAAR